LRRILPFREDFTTYIWTVLNLFVVWKFKRSKKPKKGILLEMEGFVLSNSNVLFPFIFRLNVFLLLFDCEKYCAFFYILFHWNVNNQICGSK